MAKKQFKAESKRLLDLMINSIYTNKEIFLREIISNASDAIDKLCYLSLTDDKVGLNRDDFKIDIIPDKTARTITVRDNGIGMSLQEAEQNLGVIAKSGSFKFKGEMEAEKAESEDNETLQERLDRLEFSALQREEILKAIKANIPESYILTYAYPENTIFKLAGCRVNYGKKNGKIA